MNYQRFRVIFCLMILCFISCKSHNQKLQVKEYSNDSLEYNNIPQVNIREEINVYSDFIESYFMDKTYSLNLKTPDEYVINRILTEEEVESYKKEYYERNKRFKEMIDSSKLTLVLMDTLYTFKNLLRYSTYRLDTSQIRLYQDLIYDTLSRASAWFNLDSLDLKRIHLERYPDSIVRIFKIDKSQLSADSNEYYMTKTRKFWVNHFNKQVCNRYYIGLVSLSRVIFNRDSSACLLDFSYTSGFLAGRGSSYLLIKKNKRWIILKEFTNWVS